MHVYRSHTCADLNKSNVGETVRLSGWVHRVRDHGGLLFIDLRDHYGITQVMALIFAWKGQSHARLSQPYMRRPE